MNFEQQQLMLAVADAIENDPASYKQTHWIEVTECGTTCCIAGWAVKIAQDEDFERVVSTARAMGIYYESSYAYEEHDSWFLYTAMDLLGLERNEAHKLFGCNWRPAAELTVPEALRKFAGGAELEEITGPLGED